MTYEDLVKLSEEVKQLKEELAEAKLDIEKLRGRVSRISATTDRYG